MEFPTVVPQAVQPLGDVCANAPQRQPCGEDLPGVLVAEHKTVTGINAEVAETTEPSGLNRWLGAAPWAVQPLHERRLAGPQQAPQPRDSARGIIPIDHTRVAPAGQLREDAGDDGDHAAKRQTLAHDDLIAHDGCPSGQHEALECRRFRTRADWAATAAAWPARAGGREAASADDRRRAPFKSPTRLGCARVDGVVERQRPGPWTCDRDCTTAPVRQHLDQQARSSGGEVKCQRTGWVRGVDMNADAMAAQIPTASRQRVRGGHRTPG